MRHVDVATITSYFATHINYLGLSACLLKQHHIVMGANLVKIGPIHLAILGWPYQGLSHAHANQGLKNPRS
jgi:hypothetical protein